MKSASPLASAVDIPPAPVAESSHAAATPTFIALAKVGRPYGLTGALHWYPYSQDAQTLLKAREVTIGSTVYAVTKSRRHGESI
ncbi:MAG TPA: hypothetical protein PKN64_14730, partial [Casimicrobium sp.]|nr:hypothetical protein [Casimicrobium sp.]